MAQGFLSLPLPLVYPEIWGQGLITLQFLQWQNEASETFSLAAALGYVDVDCGEPTEALQICSRTTGRLGWVGVCGVALYRVHSEL